MFERFSPSARAAVEAAFGEAVRRGDGWIGTEHLLVGLLSRGGEAAQALAGHGLTLEAVRARVDAHVPAGADDDLDAAALATLGIDLDAVRLAAEGRFGPGALARPKGRRPRATRRAVTVLKLARADAKRRHGDITATDLLLGLLAEGRGLGARVLREEGVDLAALCTDLTARDTDAA